MSRKMVLPARALASGEVVVGTLEWSDYLSIQATVYRGPTVAHVMFAVDAGKEIPDRYWARGGQCTEEFKEAYPEYANLLQYHLFDKNGPLHYVANTTHLAGDRDCWGLRAGESRQIRNGKTGQLCWTMRGIVAKYYDGDSPPNEAVVVKWEPLLRIGEGKKRELDLARSAACWPEATDEELSVEPEELKATLQARLPALLARFRADVKAALGWEIP